MSGERGGLGPHERRLSGVVASPGLDPAASGEGLAHLFACLRRAVDLLDDCGFDIDARVVEAHAAQLARGEEWPGDPIPDRWPVDRLPSPLVQTESRFLMPNPLPSDGQGPVKRRWRVYCSQWASCGWAGYRRAVTADEAKAKPCPKCEREVAF